MEYLIDVRFEDKAYNALVHLLASFNCKDEQEAKLFVSEIKAALERRGITITQGSYDRLDNDEAFRNDKIAYYNDYIKSAKATLQIEQFILNTPDQGKSLAENLTKRFFNGEESTAIIGRKYNLPVRVKDKTTWTPITDNIYYFSLEHLIPKS